MISIWIFRHHSIWIGFYFVSKSWVISTKSTELYDYLWCLTFTVTSKLFRCHIFQMRVSCICRPLRIFNRNFASIDCHSDKCVRLSVFNGRNSDGNLSWADFQLLSWIVGTLNTKSFRWDWEIRNVGILNKISKINGSCSSLKLDLMVID